MRGITIRAGAVAGALSLVLATGASAATLEVTKTSDPVPGACTNNDCSLREAVRRANSTGGADTIVLKAKTYRLEQPLFEDEALSGDLDVISTGGRLEITGKGRSKTTIDGEGLDRILEVFEGARLSVGQLTLTDGGTSGGGAGLFNKGRSALKNVAVRGNFAGIIGGGAWNSDEGRLQVSNSVFSGNDAGGGGGLWAENEGSVTISRSRFTGNDALDFGGGGIYNQSESRMQITRSQIAGNRAAGASTDGGGIYNQNDARLTIKDSTISGNTATHEGGGIYTQNNSTLGLVNSTLSGNQADVGGGIYANNYVYIRINFSTIAKNSATTTGGAIYTNTAGNNINRPPPFWLLRGTVVADNSSPGADNCALNAVSEPSHFDSQGSNLEDEDTCFFDRSSDQPNAAAKLRRLAKNGGTTKTHALKPSSDAVNAAPKQGCPGKDQRGVKRPQGSRCDGGSYELKQH